MDKPLPTRLHVAVPLIVLVAGCGAPVPTHKVTGTVTFKGKLLTSGLVAFHHTDGTAPMAKGEIRADGTYELSTYHAGDGAAAGKCKVTVSSIQPAKGVEGVDPNYRPAKALIPLKYMRLVETPLTAVVEAKDNVIPLTLVP
jgi:hypothetical protein